MARYNLRSRKQRKVSSSDIVVSESELPVKHSKSSRVKRQKVTDDSDNEELSDIDNFIDDSSISDDSDNEDDLCTPVILSLTSMLSKKFPKLNRKKLQRYVKRGLTMDRVNLVMRHYLNHRDNPTDIPEDQIKLTLKHRKRVKERLIKQMPTMADIIAAKLNCEMHERAIIMHSILSDTDPFSLEYIDMKDKLVNLIKNNRNFKYINHHLYNLRETNIHNRYNLEKIITAPISEENKLKALDLFDALSVLDVAHPDYEDIVLRLDDIMKKIVEPDHSALEDELKASCQPSNVDYKSRILKLDAPFSVKGVLYDMCDTMMSLPRSSDRYQNLYNKLNLALRLPYNQVLPVSDNISDVKARLDQGIFGMASVKEQILQAVINRQKNPHSSVILALEGPPGVGKTKVAKTIADALNLPFNIISFGGSIDSTILKGSDNVWSGAGPSAIVNILAKSKCANPVVLLDEVDKLGQTRGGTELQNALLHLLDPTQNVHFTDGFLNEFTHDISQMWIIIAMNDANNLSTALRDRLQIIKIPAYNAQEKHDIVLDYTFNECLHQVGFNNGDVSIDSEAIKTLISLIDDKKSGMRKIKATLTQILSKIHMACHVDPKTLSYSLPNFNGLPYTISNATITALVPKPKTVPYHPMYI